MAKDIKSPEQLKKEVETLEEDLTIALNALRFYGNRLNWLVTMRRNEDKTTYFTSDVADDNGTRARITCDSILKDRKHKRFIEDSKYTYTDDMLRYMGYQIMELQEGFIIAQAPKKQGDLFLFAGTQLNFTMDMLHIKTFENKQLARIAISNHINRGAFMIKNKPKEDNNGQG